MGSQQSVPLSRKKKTSIRRSQLVRQSSDVSGSTLASISDEDISTSDAIDPASIAKWEESLLSDPKVFLHCLSVLSQLEWRSNDTVI